MKWQLTIVLLSVVASISHAQSTTQDGGSAQETQARGYWTDPSTGLMWAGKDNGKDVNWHNAVKYCHSLRLADHSDWRLATLDELRGIFDKTAEASGLAGPHKGREFTWHVKGNLFLTGNQWSSTHRVSDQGYAIGLAWYFDFKNGRRNDEDASRFLGLQRQLWFARALCAQLR